MSSAMATSQPRIVQVEAAGKAAIRELQGRVDALEDKRLFGWVWLPGRHEERIEVRVLSGDLAIATGTADRPRVDLRRSGIGDGNHAFEIHLPPLEEGRVRETLTVVAIHPATGAGQPLRIPTIEERSAEMAASTPFNMIMDRLDGLIALMRSSHQASREATQGVLRAADQLGTVTAADGPLGSLPGGQQALCDRLGELEVCLIRVDATIADLNGRLARIADQGTNILRPHLLLLTAATGFIAGIAAYAAMGM